MNTEWVKQQFEEARVKLPVGKAVLKLLEFWEKEVKLSKADSEEALTILSKLVFGHSLVPENKEQIWVPAQRGQISVGDRVRVVFNAFDGQLGQLHNGRSGVIVAIRSGDVIFKSNDGLEPVIDGAHYKPEHLEKRLK